jgi:hypothetical protein
LNGITWLGLAFQDIAVHGGRLELIETAGENTQLCVLSNTFSITSAAD